MSVEDDAPFPVQLARWGGPFAAGAAASLAAGTFESPRWGLAATLAIACWASCAVAARGDGMTWRRGLTASLHAVAMLSLCALASPWIIDGVARADAFDWLAGPVALLLRTLGVDAHAAGGEVAVLSGQLFEFSVDASKLGLVVIAFVAAASPIALSGCGLRSAVSVALRATTITGLYLVARFAALSAFALHHPDPGYEHGARYGFIVAPYIDGLWVTLSLVPLVVLLARWAPIPSSMAATGASTTRRASRRVRFAAAAFLGVCGACALAVWTATSRSSESRRQGVVVIDELHSPDWSSAVAPLDREHFGRDTSYSYTALVRHLAQDFEVTVEASERYTDESLAQASVLVIKPATKQFARTEIDAIERFVGRGGGLFVIGDHTDLLGSTTNLNELLVPFGAQLRRDACNRLEDGQTQSWKALPWEVHPTVAGLGPIEFQTTCSLEVDASYDRVMLVRNSFSDPVDYARFSFFGNVAPDLNESLGPQVVAAARESGAGRVAIFADSTIFSSFCLTWDDRSEYLTRTVDWLRRGGAERPSASRSAVLACFAVALMIALLRAALSTAWLPPAAIACAVGALAGAAFASAHNVDRHALPSRPRPIEQVAFLMDGCRCELPSPLSPTETAPNDAFDTLYTWVYRVGAMPVRRESFDPNWDGAWALIRPTPEFLREHGERVLRGVRAGARILVAFDRGSPSEQELRSLVPGIVTSVGGDDAAEQDAPRRLALGQGRLLVYSNAEDLSRSGLGHQLDKLDRASAAYDHSQRLFEGLEWLVAGPGPLPSIATSNPTSRRDAPGDSSARPALR